MMKHTRPLAGLLSGGLTANLWGAVEDGKKKEAKPAQTQSAPATTVKDPVCGMNLDPAKYVKYFFCPRAPL